MHYSPIKKGGITSWQSGISRKASRRLCVKPAYDLLVLTLKDILWDPADVSREYIYIYIFKQKYEENNGKSYLVQLNSTYLAMKGIFYFRLHGRRDIEVSNHNDSILSMLCRFWLKSATLRVPWLKYEAKGSIVDLKSGIKSYENMHLLDAWPAVNKMFVKGKAHFRLKSERREPQFDWK